MKLMSSIQGRAWNVEYDFTTTVHRCLRGATTNPNQ